VPVLDGYSEVTLVWQALASIKEFTCSFGVLDISLGDRTATEIADDVYGAAIAGSSICEAGAMMDDYRFLGVKCAKGTSTGDILGQVLATITGSVSDSCPPSNCALLIHKSTALGGRRYRGRFFAPMAWINEGAVDSVGVVTGSTISSAISRWNEFYDNVLAAELTPVLFHQGAGAPVPTAITGFQVQSQLATQRRRMRG